MKDYVIRPVKENDLQELLILIDEHVYFVRAPFDQSADKETLRTALFDQPVRLHYSYDYVLKLLNGLI